MNYGGRFFLTSLHLVAATSCTFPRTQAVVEIRADRLVEAQASQIRITVRNGDDSTIAVLSLNPQANDFPGFPIVLPVSARHGQADRRFSVEVEALQNRRAEGSTHTTSLAQNRVRTTFIRGQITRLTLWLLAGCRCDAETERCVPDDNQDLVPECIPMDVSGNSDGGVTDGVVATSMEDAPYVDAGTRDAVAEAGPMGCAPAEHLCNGQCVSRFSPLFCGESCSACPTVSGATSVCENESCGVVCGVNTPDRCGAACVDLASDAANCGRCGLACGTGYLCQSGECIEPPQCIPGDSTCSGLTYCAANRRCSAGCDRSSQCANDRMCNTATHTCECRSDLLACGTACALCPSGGAITDTACRGNTCAVTACAPGFEPNPSGTGCQDINECATLCAPPSSCTNAPGSFTCTCAAPNRTCANQCVACPSDVNVVATARLGGGCVVTACSAGFVPANNGGACLDINECATNNGGCDEHATCTNLPGSRSCVCNAGYTGDGQVCAPVCSPQCSGRVCGPDGCGGSCGTCMQGVCNASGQCESATSSWVLRNPATRPPARGQHILVYDAARQRVVLYGGWNSTQYFGDTWEWDGNNWTQRNPSTSPSARGECTVAYDGGRQRIVLYGGVFQTTYYRETWEWDGSIWANRTLMSNPSYRIDNAMAYDDARQNIVLFGGGSPRNFETWLFSAGSWQEVFPTGHPSARTNHAMAYDAARQRVLLFSGYTNNGRVNDTWSWNGSNWIEHTPSRRPPARSSHAMTYDSARQRVVLFGGATGDARLNDTWEWNGTNWTEIATTVRPQVRASHAMAYDVARQEVVLFGGWNGTADLDDTWVYRVN